VIDSHPALTPLGSYFRSSPSAIPCAHYEEIISICEHKSVHIIYELMQIVVACLLTKQAVDGVMIFDN
jgi:hypothetical protein